MNYYDRGPYGIYNGLPEGGPGPSLMGANTLIGEDVYSPGQEKLGDIKEIMLDMRTGRVSYAVLSFGGFLSLGEKLFAVPWTALTLDTENKRFLLNVTKERLEDAPGFNKDKWPDMADETWASGVRAYWDRPSHNEPTVGTLSSGAPITGGIL